MGKDLTTLRELKTAEVSLVNRGANKKKPFPFFKELEEDDMPDMEEILKAVLETETDGEKELEEVFKKAKVSEKGQSAAKGALRILNAFKDEMPADVMAKLAKVAGMVPETKQKEKENEEEYPEKSKVAKEELMAALPEEVRKQVEPILKQQTSELEAVSKRAEEVEKQLKVERDARELDQWVEKARTELSHFPGKSAEELGKSLKGLADVNKELADEQFTQMKAASDALKSSSFLKESGTSMSTGEAGPGSAWDKIEKAAAGLVQKSETPMTHAQAIAKVMEEQPELYQEYLKEHPKQTADIG